MTDDSSITARVRAVLRDRFVPNAVFDPFIQELSALIEHPSKDRPHCVALIGDSGFGKSAILRRLTRMHLPVSDAEEPIDHVPLVVVNVPEKADLAALYRLLLHTVGGYCRNRDPLDVLRREVVAVYGGLDVRVVAFDEFNNAVFSSQSKQRELMNGIKMLANDLRHPLVVAGTRGVESFLESDEQMSSRFRRIRLPRWEVNDDTRRFLKTYEQDLELTGSSLLGSRAMTGLLVELSGGCLGLMVRILTETAAQAVRDGTEVITPDALRRFAVGLAPKALRATVGPSSIR